MGHSGRKHRLCAGPEDGIWHSGGTRKGRNSWKGREGQAAANIYLADLERDSGTDPEQQAVVEGFKNSVFKSPLWLLGFGWLRHG